MFIKRNRREEGFTLVELLVVMAIMAILIGISVAGLGFAMRRSRNIARSSAMSNLDKAFASHYADKQNYPAETGGIRGLVASGGALSVYMEGSWDPGPPNSVYCYRYDSTNVIYSVCVSQENGTGGSTNPNDFLCAGPGVGKTGWPAKNQDSCESSCGTCVMHTGDNAWNTGSLGNHVK